MKKIFTLLSIVMLMFAANANARKTWDFSKGVSDESRALLDGDATWTKTATDGVTSSWASAANINGEAMAGGQVVKELSGLQFGDFAATNALLYRITSIRLQKNCSVTIPDVSAGEKIVIKAQSANATATNRGFVLDNAIDAEGNNSFTILGRDAEGAVEGGVYTIEVTAQADGAVKLSTGINGAPASGIEILSIIVGEGDKNIKKWDFSAFSQATVAQVCGADDWTTSESASKNYITGNEIRWINTPTLDANEDLTAGGAAIKELQGLRHTGLAQYNLGLAFDYDTTTDGNNWGPYNGGSYIWVMGTATTIVVPNVKAGSTFKVASESHKPSEARGFNVTVNGAAVASSTGTSTSAAYTEFEYTIPTGDDDFVDVTLKATKGCHLYFIEAEVKDETFVDKNPKLGAPTFAGLPKGKVNPETATGFTMTFPKAQNIDPQTTVTIEGYFGPTEFEDGESAEDYMFDGLEGTVGEGISFTYSDYLTLEENKNYEIYFTKIIVDGYEALSVEAAEGEKLYGTEFATSGPGIQEARAWNFTTTAEQAEALAGSTKWAASSKGRYSWPTPMTYGQFMIDDETPFSVTEGLYFSMGTANDILIGTPDGNNGRLQLGGGSPDLIIPSCSEGDEITIKALWSTKNSGVITITNGTSGESNEITLTGSSAEYKITVTGNDDVVLKSKNVVYQTISIYPASMGKEKVVYTINATDPEGNVLQEIATGEGQSNDMVDVNFSYYLMDKDGKFYTKGTRGTEFKESVTLLTGQETYNVEYKAKEFDGCVKGVFCAEAEDLAGTILSNSTYCGIRASNAKAAVPDMETVSLTTLPAGTYKIHALVWDTAKNGGVATMKFQYGDKAEDVVEVISTGDNMSEAEAYLVLEEAREIIWLKEGTSDSACLDAILIYEYDSESAADAVAADVNASKAIKCIENGAIVIKTAKGVFNVAGMQLK